MTLSDTPTYTPTDTPSDRATDRGPDTLSRASARAHSNSISSSFSSSTSNPPTSTADVVGGGDLIQALRDRGVAGQNAHSLVAAFPAERITNAIAYFDALTVDAGPGLLVNAIREGRTVRRKPSSSLARQREYTDQIRAWLTEHFPDLCDPKWGPHPASIAAVIRLHYTEGRGTLRAGKHGPVIRQAVRDFDKRIEDKGEQHGSTR